MKQSLRLLMLAAALMCSVGLRAQNIENDPRLESPTTPYEIRQDDDIQARLEIFS